MTVHRSGATTEFDVAVIGGGIAGVSAAFAIAAHPSQPSVVVVEAEQHLAFHTTGRSAAQLIENYGAMPIRSLTRASLDFLHQPPSGLTDAPLLDQRSVLTVGSADQDEAIDRNLAEGKAGGSSIDEVDFGEASGHFPALRQDWFHRAVLDESTFDIDVGGLHQSFVRGLRSMGGEIRTEFRVSGISDDPSGGWLLDNAGEHIECGVVVNAAGAWGDEVAKMAGVEPVGLTPMRRTAFMVRSPDRWPESAAWPLVADAEHRWYVKPDGRQLLCSPADEQPSEPCDAKAEEVDVAMAIDRINQATTLDIRSVASSWAGLRTFAPDRSMVIGPDTEHPGFWWCVGQGGTGIQTARAAGQLVADLGFDGAPSSFFDTVSLDVPGLSVGRLRNR